MVPADIAIAWRFFTQLRSYLRVPLDPGKAHAILRERLQHREDGFLAVAREAIYADAGSPYRMLLGNAGCEYGDLEKMVRRDGLEVALASLYRAGVYLTVDELKGRRPARRGSASIAVDPERLRNPWSAYHLPVRTGGSRGPALPILVDLAALRELAVDSYLAFEAHGGASWVKGLWAAPGGSLVSAALLIAIGFGSPPDRWFLYLDPSAPGLHARYRWSLRLMRWGSWLAGMPFPRPFLVPLTDPRPIAEWMSEVLRRGQTPHLAAHPSAAARVCEVALQSGLDLRGARFSLRGEPITAGRLAPLRRAGAEGIPLYGTIECGAIGNGCAAPQWPDEVHVLEDLHALVRLEEDDPSAGLPRGALLLSSLRRTARLILLNVSMGDVGTVERRPCGCALEALGWTARLHSISSFEKLTAAGMTFQDSNVVHVLEEVLPARFGGSALDYQLVESADDDGQAQLRLVVSPSVGPLDTREVAEVFLSAIGGGSGVERVMQLVWRDAGVLCVERAPVRSTAAGKILHLHSNRPQGGS